MERQDLLNKLEIVERTLEILGRDAERVGRDINNLKNGFLIPLKEELKEEETCLIKK